jgi:thioredoxin
MAPIVAELSGEFAGKARFVKLNIPDNFELTRKLGVPGAPTLLMFEDGRVIETLVGGDYSKGTLTSYLNRRLGA